MPSRILVVEDDANLCQTFQRFLAKDGYLVDTAGDYPAAMQLLGEGRRAGKRSASRHSRWCP